MAGSRKVDGVGDQLLLNHVITAKAHEFAELPGQGSSDCNTKVRCGQQG